MTGIAVDHGSSAFTAALRDALLVPDSSASEEQVRQIVINQIRELDPAAVLRTTGYFNHSWVPDLNVSWGDDNERHLFLRFDVTDPGFAEDLRYAADERAPMFLDIAQPELALEAVRRPGIGGAAPADDAIEESGAMVADHAAWGVLGAGVEADPRLRSATRQIVRGGQGYVGKPIAYEVVSAFAQASAYLEPSRVRQTTPDELRLALDTLEKPLSRIASLDLETDLRVRWVQGGRQPELFPGLEDWNLQDRLPEEIATLVIALLTSDDYVPEERWIQIARAISVDALGAATRGGTRIVGGKLNELVRAARDIWTARWAWVPSHGDAIPAEGRLDWSLGGTGLELNLGAHRAVFADRGNRFNMMPKPDAVPALEPRLEALQDAAVTGVEVSSTEETVSVYLAASATETLGERLGRLMAEQADIRISGRLESIELKVPATENVAEINFRSGKVHAEHPVSLATFADIIARIMLALPTSDLEELERRSLAAIEPEDERGG